MLWYFLNAQTVALKLKGTNEMIYVCNVATLIKNYQYVVMVACLETCHREISVHNINQDCCEIEINYM